MAYRLRPRSIHGELALLVGVLVLPFVAMTAYLLYAQAERDLEEARGVVRQLADGHADRAAGFIADTRAVLQAVAWRPLVRAMDAARCDPGLRELLDLYPKAANFLVVDREGRVLCDAIPSPAAPRIFDSALLREALATGGFALSRPILSRVGKRWAMAAVQPVIGTDGAIAGAVSMAIDLADWDLLAVEGELPEGTIVALLSGGRVIARTSDAEQWIGRDVTGVEIMEKVRSGAAGVIRARGVAEADRFWGFREVPGTDWAVLAGMPAERVIGPVRERCYGLPPINIGLNRCFLPTRSLRARPAHQPDKLQMELRSSRQ
jgi:hypothetical protein